MTLRCVYTDLDGTLLGKWGSLFRDADGEFSMLQARALEACHRAGVEVVIMSGRRQPQVMSDARLMGQTSYIYEAGCAVVIDREESVLTGRWSADESGTPAEKMVAAGIPELLFERFAGRLDWHAPWHTDRRFSLLFRGDVDVAEANAAIAEAGHADLRFLDNGVIFRKMEGIERAHAYHLVPGEASKANGVSFHMRARGYAPGECIAVGDSAEDLDAASVVGRFFAVANGPAEDAAMRAGIARFDNVTLTEGRMGDGFYEAVVSSLMGDR